MFEKQKKSFLKENILKISKILHENYSEIWTYSYPYFEKWDNLDLEEMQDFSCEEVSIYIHIPFCNWKCKYCKYHGNNDIISFGSKNYLELILKELEFKLGMLWYNKYLSSLLIWWGTPTLLNSEDVLKLINEIKEFFIVDKFSQISIESTPWMLWEKVVKDLKIAWFNRISIWVQSFDEKILYENNRYQKNISVYNAFKILRNNHINNINIDLIYWLKYKETIKDFLDANLDHILTLKPQSIEIYPNQDVFNNSRIVQRNLIKDVNIICDYINSLFWEQRAFTQLDIWRKGLRYGSKRFPFNRSKYHFDRRYLLKPLLWLGFWAIGDCLNKDWNLIFSKFKAQNLYEYKKSIDNSKFIYKYKKLDYQKTIKNYFIRNLRIWLRKDILKNIFPFEYQKKYINSLLFKIKNFIMEDDNCFFLWDNYFDLDLYGINNANLKYFLFIFLYIYNEDDKRKFLKDIFKR